MPLQDSNRLVRILSIGGMTAAVGLSIAMLASNLQSANTIVVPNNVEQTQNGTEQKVVDSDLVRLNHFHETGGESNPSPPPPPPGGGKRR